MTPNSPEATMLLITSTWADKPTFKLMPVLPSLFVEGIYDVESKVLVVITTVKKDSFHMVPKLNIDGDSVKASKGPRPISGKTYQEERKQLETFQEYYITEKREIDNFIKLVAVNAESFDFAKYTDVSGLVKETKPTLIALP